ncbi:hypothetical protein BGZ92_002373 [Podila epicladia]|nr:hypothetical protein BGZ92_002373 [Podila epicladia]
MEDLGALKQRHFKSVFDSGDDVIDATLQDIHTHARSTKKVHSSFSSPKTILQAWCLFLGFLFVIVMITFQLHYTLPTPLMEGSDPISGQAQFSEHHVREVVRYMTRDIGYRVVGTEQELETKTYLIKELARLREEAQVESMFGAKDLPNFEMWVQVGDGSHRFDFMSKVFNGGEESLQDASHSFITAHELKDNVRAVVNLEACGTSGPEVLFQANSREMIEAYRTVPYPHGTVLANDLFATGLILSDTDFRQFVDHGNLTGLDMAVYKNSYLYHTHLDLDEFMEAGLPQHMGENALALATYLTEEANLVNLERTSSIVFFDVFGLFFVSYSWTAAIRSHLLIGGLALFTVASGASRPTVRRARPPIRSTGANELSIFSGLQLFFAFALAGASYVGLASSYVFALFTLSATIAMIFNHKKTAEELEEGSEVTRMDYSTYFVGALLPTAYFSFVCFSLLDMFIPLTGRIGVTAPVDTIVAVMSGFVTFVFCPPILAFSHRFGRMLLKKIIWSLFTLHLITVLISSAVMNPYDEFHPKRVFVQHMRNMTSGESLLYLAHADPGPFYEPYVAEVETMFKTQSTFRSANSNPADWNAIYPFNQFLESYVLDTTEYIRSHTTNNTIAESKAPLTDLIQGAPKLVAENVSYDPKTGLRKLTILCMHPNYIWTVASFDTHLASWSLSSSDPFPYSTHYVIRHVGGHVSDGWRVDLEHYATGPNDKLRIELTAMETEGFGKDTERELTGSGEIGVMRKIVKSRPLWTTLTYFSILTSTFEL